MKTQGDEIRKFAMALRSLADEIHENADALPQDLLIKASDTLYNGAGFFMSIAEAMHLYRNRDDLRGYR